MMNRTKSRRIAAGLTAVRIFGIRALAVAAVLAAATGIAAPKEKTPDPSAPQFVGAADDWSAWHYVENGTRVCYTIARPASSKGTIKGRGEAALLVTFRQSRGKLAKSPLSGPVVSVEAGYRFKSGLPVRATQGKTEFALFSDGVTAWAADTEGDKALVAALEKGGTLTIRGEPASGGAIVDTYRLAGFRESYAQIQKRCDAR